MAVSRYPTLVRYVSRQASVTTLTGSDLEGTEGDGTHFSLISLSLSLHSVYRLTAWPLCTVFDSSPSFHYLSLSHSFFPSEHLSAVEAGVVQWVLFFTLTLPKASISEDLAKLHHRRFSPCRTHSYPLFSLFLANVVHRLYI